MITLLGLFGPMIAVLNLIIHDTSMSILLPWWTYLFGAISIFFYQTMDAVDGK